MRMNTHTKYSAEGVAVGAWVSLEPNEEKQAEGVVGGVG